MDVKKSIDDTLEPKIINPPIEDDLFDDLEMQPIPVIETDMKSLDPSSMSIPFWHNPIMSDEPTEMQNELDEELDDMKQPTDHQPQMSDLQLDEVKDISTMRSYGEYHEYYPASAYSNFNYREYNQLDFNEYDDIEDILRKIERYNPGVLRRLISYGIPFPAARNIVRRIIRLTLNYK